MSKDHNINEDRNSFGVGDRGSRDTCRCVYDYGMKGDYEAVLRGFLVHFQRKFTDES